MIYYGVIYFDVEFITQWNFRAEVRADRGYYGLAADQFL